jgi:hypothetical protein
MLDALSLILDGLANLGKGPRQPGWARGAWIAFCVVVLVVGFAVGLAAGLGALVYAIIP